MTRTFHLLFVCDVISVDSDQFIAVYLHQYKRIVTHAYMYVKSSTPTIFIMVFHEFQLMASLPI